MYNSWNLLTKLVVFQGVTVTELIPQSSSFATGCADGVVRIWDFRTSRCLQELHGFSSGVLCMDVSLDGKHVLAGSDDGTVRVFEIV